MNTDKKKALAVGLSIVWMYYGILFFILRRLNIWFKKISLFEITFMGVDLRVYAIGFVFAVFGVWLLLEIDDYLQYQKWRRTWK